MSTSREKVNKIIDMITERFGIGEIDLVVKKIDVKSELNKKVADIKDSDLDGLMEDIKKVVNE